jgi:predicted nuclease of predicted toxin-antitoxin system
MIILDEKLDSFFENSLEQNGFRIFPIRKHNRAISDKELAEIVIKEKAILLTEEKDFGELTFSHKIQHCSVILLRFQKWEKGDVENNLQAVLLDDTVSRQHVFITITSKKIRIRKI